MIEEEKETHDCKPIFKGVKEIMFDSLHAGNLEAGIVDDNGDLYAGGMGLDGYHYRLIRCKHNPPHGQVKFDPDPTIKQIEGD